MRTHAWLGWALALFLVGCGASAPPRPPGPPPPPKDPWIVTAGPGVTLGEPNAAFVPKTSTARSTPAIEEQSLVKAAPGADREADPAPAAAKTDGRGRPDELAAKLQALKPGLRRCHDRALQRDPAVRAPSAAELHWDGYRSVVLFKGQPARPGSLEACLADVIARGLGSLGEDRVSITIPINQVGL